MKRIVFLMVALVTVATIVSTLAGAAGSAKKIVVNVISQPRREWELIEKYLPEFEEKEGIDVVIHYFAELERRSKSRMDAATKAGQYQVYYIDEANVAEFTVTGQLLPLKDYYPAEYDFDDLSEPLVKVLSYKGVAYGAPMTFEGDIMFYRKDLLEANAVPVPTTPRRILTGSQVFPQTTPIVWNWNARTSWIWNECLEVQPIFTHVWRKIS